MRLNLSIHSYKRIDSARAANHANSLAVTEEYEQIPYIFVYSKN